MPYRCIALVCIWLGLLSAFETAVAEIRVTLGPTPIPRGDARGEKDITINNGRFALALAVDTAPPWGVARGGIIDIAIVREGEIGYDIASLADFMPNNWSGWPTSYQHVEIETHTAQEIVIKTLRDWGEVELETRFTLRDRDSRVHLHTRMTNRGSTTLKGLLSGYVVWPDGGYLFGIPGLPGQNESSEVDALADWSVAYDENWALGLHAPFSEQLSYAGRDRYRPHELAPGASATFEAWLQIEAGGSLAPMVQTEIELQQLPAGTLYGQVLDTAGNPVAQPALVVLKNGQPYSWVLGSNGVFELTLPAGEYQAYATARAHARSATRDIMVLANHRIEQNFEDVATPGAASFMVRNQLTGEALDARISIDAGQKPLLEHFGKKTFFTELDAPGRVAVNLAPGHYRFEVSAGAGFVSLPQQVELEVKAGSTQAVVVDIPILLMPQERNWYSADLHHHSDVLDGFTEPEFVLRAELASGVDLAFLSDHDSTLNNPELQRLAATRGRAFIAGTELSPSWAHFNAYPVAADKTLAIDVGRSTVQAIFAEARRLGADVIHVNHPYGDYGYFRSLELHTERDGILSNAVPGGYDGGFDLVEITAGNNQQTMRRVWAMWNEGKRAYLAAGSDVHDVWNQISGAARSFVYVPGELTVARFVAALKRGEAYASQGPLVYPELMFGRQLQQVSGTALKLAYSVKAVSGLRAVRLIERGHEVAIREYSAEQTAAEVVFKPVPVMATWYSLVIEDAAGKFAYTNPVWVGLSEEQGLE